MLLKFVPICLNILIVFFAAYGSNNRSFSDYDWIIIDGVLKKILFPRFKTNKHTVGDVILSLSNYISLLINIIVLINNFDSVKLIFSMSFVPLFFMFISIMPLTALIETIREKDSAKRKTRKCVLILLGWLTFLLLFFWLHWAIQ